MTQEKVAMSRLINAEISRRLDSVPGWEIRDENAVNQLSRSFEFENFAAALEFTNRVGELGRVPRAQHQPMEEVVTWI